VKIPANSLCQKLQNGLAGIYLVSGDDPLLVGEACDAIRGAARAQGFDERDLYVADRGFDWEELLASGSNLSLFATRRILELRLPTGKPGDKGGKAIAQLALNQDPDTLVLVVVPQLDKRSLGTTWAKSIDDAGVVVQIWPVEESQMPGWIKQRLRASGLQANEEAVRLLAMRVEGNLMAAQQEIDKLVLLHGNGKLDADMIQQAVSNSSRFDIFDLVDAALAGDAARSLRILEGLREEGVEPVLIGWALSREMRTLSPLAWQIAHGDAPTKVLGKVWARRKPLVSAALGRHSSGSIHALQLQLARADRVVKGQASGAIWDELGLIVAKLAGTNLKLKATG
jgi:DNA polymerase-3 subunit delta